MSSANLPKVGAVPEVDSISEKQRSRDDVALRIAALLLIVLVVAHKPADLVLFNISKL